MSMAGIPHRRRNPLTGRWVLVSPHRLQRPWQGQEEAADATRPPAYDPTCYLCPGNARAGGAVNPAYAGPHAFTNDYAALLPGDGAGGEDDPLFTAQGVAGTCRVICYSPDHGAGLGDLPLAGVRAVIDCWAAEAAALGADYPCVQIFENRGAMMGASNPHPHGQVWATAHLTDEMAAEDAHQRAYVAQHGRALLGDLAEREAGGPRVVEANADWLVIVPYWAAWPFETLLLPRFAVARLPELDDARRDSLAAVLQALIRRYDALFGCAFPYSMGWHGAPFGAAAESWRLHAHFYPPLLRSASVRKFMVGFELLGEPQRDLMPEDAAARLRAVAA
ncbi:UDP-glucose--hexose-1-phosphate uridylyltransferase [Sphingomonas sp.]|uniref:UDP-glucose--hexose-1-phosphate uridylyltransferase n=1 Tax=Sphingomonas sp. TaxID=28214 RepID=UPI001DF3210E|nr:UDP-glucose--hexose-1-phosphate uridylyltransferase [Sphingomonas sp.]MBX9795720.1 UDP-glucose--hexose-1-phosphate uridylyltransferase [Sphingomonas sp.]